MIRDGLKGPRHPREFCEGACLFGLVADGENTSTKIYIYIQSPPPSVYTGHQLNVGMSCIGQK